MSDQQQDADLRARFQAQREAEKDNTPQFADVMARARAEAAALPASKPRMISRRRNVYLSWLAAAATIAALLVIPRATSHLDDEFERTVRAFQNDPATGAWRSPTDGLLNVPGSQLISTVPGVGTQ